MGLFEVRNVYQQFGHPLVTKDMVPFEDALLARHGISVSHLRSQAMVEASFIDDQLDLDPRMLTDKEYLLTHKERMDSGKYTGLYPEQTASIITNLVDEHWAAKLSFNN